MYYEKYRKIGGYKSKVQYQQLKESNQNKNKRKCITILFNPSHSNSVKTNIRGIFIKLISKHFLPKHKILKVFNKSKINFSCFCMPNIRSDRDALNYNSSL